MRDFTTIPDDATVQYRDPDEDTWTTLTHEEIEGGVAVGDLRERDLWPDVANALRMYCQQVRFLVDSGSLSAEDVDLSVTFTGGER